MNLNGELAKVIRDFLKKNGYKAKLGHSPNGSYHGDVNVELGDGVTIVPMLEIHDVEADASEIIYADNSGIREAIESLKEDRE